MNTHVKDRLRTWYLTSLATIADDAIVSIGARLADHKTDPRLDPRPQTDLPATEDIVVTVSDHTMIADVAKLVNEIGYVFSMLNEGEKAMDYYLTAINLHQFLYGPMHPVLATGYSNIGSFHVS